MWQAWRAYHGLVRVWVSPLAIVLLAAPASTQRPTASALPRPAAVPSAPLTNSDGGDALHNQPIRFEPLAEQGMFLARGIGSAIRLSGTSIDFPIGSGTSPGHSLRVQFLGAKRSSRVAGIDPLPGRVNYLFGDDPARWRTNVRTYARARTASLYRGIDVLYYGADNRLEYDLIVRPGADPDSIRIAIRGDSVAISDAGDLVYGSDDHVLLHKPIAYQTIGGVRREVAVLYRQHEDGSVGFAVGSYDPSQILVIDPIVAYSFSFGGSGDEQVYDIVVDETGAVYVGGETYSVDFPTVNPAQPRQDAGDPCVFYGNSICRDAFLAKLAADGKSLEYATYFGSASFDQVNHIVVDSSHALYFAGWTTTETTSAQPDVRNSFLGKLAPDGSHFVYTYFSPRCCLSGPQLTINDLAVGPDGSAYVAVSTPATAEIATLSPAGDNYQSIYTLTDPSGVSRTSFNGIAVQGDSVFVGGTTTWSGFPTTWCCFNTPGIRNGVVMQLSLTGSVIKSLLLSVRNAITITDVAVGRNGEVFVVADGSQADTACSPSSSPAHEVIIANASWALSGSFYTYAARPYPFNSCLFPPIRVAVDDQGSAYSAACGYGLEPGASVARTVCNLWRVTSGGNLAGTFSDVPWYRFTVDRDGIGRWFAPVTGQVSLIKMAAQVSLQSLIPFPSLASFGTEIVFQAVIPVAEDDVEATFWRYDPHGGWRQLHEFTSGGGPGLVMWYSWTPGWWDAGDQEVCVFVRLVGSSDQPQSACTSVTVLGVSAAQPPILPSAADFNADLRPDLLWIYDATSQLAMWNLGGGEHGERLLDAGYLNAPPLPTGWRVAGTGDVDDDGHTDLFLQSDTGQLGAWLFNGSTWRGGMLLSPSEGANPNWQIRAVGDLNGDGHPDLIWQYAPTGQVAFWLMNGTQAIGYVIPPVPAPGGDWEVIGTGDSNRDGERDIFWQQRSTGALAVWTMMHGTMLAGGSLLSANPGAEWRAVAVTDLDGDAYSDIVLQNTNTGDLGAWYLTGPTLKFGVLLVPASVGAPGWSVVGPR